VSAEKVILLLGRRDEPTDGVADYCEKLREAGFPHGLSFEPVQLPWAENGWGPALAELRRSAAGWRDRWVLLQFTTLATPRDPDQVLMSGSRVFVPAHGDEHVLVIDGSTTTAWAQGIAPIGLAADPVLNLLVVVTNSHE